MSSRLAFVLFLIVFYAVVHHVCQNRNYIDWYKNYRGFPLMVMTSKQSGPYRRGPQVQQVRYPYNIRKAANRETPTFLLPQDGSDVGVFKGNHVSYEVEPIEEGRIRVTLYNWGRGMGANWGKAVYEATDTGVKPLSISGGVHGSHPLASLALALLFAYGMNRIGYYLKGFAKDASWRERIERVREAPWYNDPLSFLLVLPFLYYWRETLDLMPYNMADSYAYLWRRSFNWHFFTGRCLTQRTVFHYLCESNLRTIVAVQLAAFAGSAVLIYALLRRHVGLMVRLGLAAAIAFIFTSYTLNIHSIVVSSEPLFIAIALVFPLVVFLWPHDTRHWAVLAFGILFIFSKNVAPFMAMGIVILAVVSDAIHRRHFPTIRMLIVYAVLGVFAIISMVITQKWDRAVDLNTLNNICQRVLTDEETTAYFIEHYGMPEGAYIQQVRGGGSGSQIDRKRLYTVLPETMNFKLREDRYGFIEWVENDARGAFTHYMFVVQPMKTLKELLAGFHDFMTQKQAFNFQDGTYQVDGKYENLELDPMYYVVSDLGPRNYESWPPDSNFNRLVAKGEHRLKGFRGYDAIVVLKNALLALGFGHLWLVLIYGLAALIAGTIIRKAHWLPVGGGIVLFGLALFFLSYFGDSSAAVRHLYPGAVVVAFGGWIMIIGFIELVFRLFLDRWRKKRVEQEQSPSTETEEEACPQKTQDTPTSS